MKPVVSVVIPTYNRRDLVIRTIQQLKEEVGVNGQTPASLYRSSHRPYTGGLPPIEYPGHFIVKMVTNAGTIRFKKKVLFVANALKQHHIGLEETDDGVWSIYFCQVLLARISHTECSGKPHLVA